MKPYYRYFFAGKTQSGKSTLVKTYLKQLNNYVVLDGIKNEFGTEYGVFANSLKEVMHLLERGVQKIIWKSPPSETIRNLDVLLRYMFINCRNFMLVIDEVQFYCNKHKISQALRDYITAGEGEPRRLGLIATSQRPQNVHNDIISQSTIRVSFVLDHDRDDALMAGYMRLSPGDLIKVEGHSYYLYNGETRKTTFYEN